jgi:RHS repeat-associated protein
MRYNGLPGTGYVGATSLLYDAADNVTSIVDKNASATVLASYLYSYNAATELSQETDNGTLITYAYDPAGQLTATTSTSYAYDANGNPDNSGDVIGTDNELMSNGVWSYTYDASGNLTEKVNISTGETWTYKYDNGNDLIQAVDTTMSGTTTSLYDYDVFGNRIEEQVVTSSATTTTKYVLDSWNPATQGGTGNSGTEVWADLTSSNTLQTVYLRGNVVDQLFGRISSGGAGAFTLLDHLQSVVGVTNASGTLEDVITYDAYGNFTESNPGMVGAYTYAGMEYDSTTQLYYSRARYYDATTGRWISQDPLGFDAGDSNLYRYVNNSPTNETDPSGETGVLANLVGGSPSGDADDCGCGGGTRFLALTDDAIPGVVGIFIHGANVDPELTGGKTFVYDDEQDLIAGEASIGDKGILYSQLTFPASVNNESTNYAPDDDAPTDAAETNAGSTGGDLRDLPIVGPILDKIGNTIGGAIGVFGGPGGPTGKPAYQLRPITVTAPTPGNNGAFNYVIDWALNKPTPTGGYIVQDIQWTWSVKNNAGGNVPEPSKLPSPVQYWEVWQVPKNAMRTTTDVDSWNQASYPGCTEGNIAIHAVAWFFDNYKLPDSAGFKAKNAKTFAHNLLSTTTNPKLPQPDSNFVSRSLEATWDALGCLDVLTTLGGSVMQAQ